MTIAFLLAVVGIASFYHDRFDGHRSASGKIFHQNELVAAHRTLAFGSKLLVRNLKNKKSVLVTIVDRGPFMAGRILDLSKSAARKIGITGLGRIEYKVVGCQKLLKRKTRKGF